jgi:hypothetical protein
MKKNLVLIALLWTSAACTAPEILTATTPEPVNPVATSVLTTVFPGLGFALKETRDEATHSVPEDKKHLFNPIFTHVAEIMEKPIRVHSRFLGSYIRDISTNVFEEQVTKTIFKETAKKLSISYKKVTPLLEKLLLVNAYMRFPVRVMFGNMRPWLYTNRPQILDDQLNPIAPSMYFPHFITRAQRLKDILAPYANKETTLILSLISTATQSQLASCQWYFIPELLNSLHKKVTKMPLLKRNKIDAITILKDIRGFKKEAEDANKFIILHSDLLAPKSEKITLIKKLSRHKKTQKAIFDGFMSAGGTTLMLTGLLGTIAREKALPIGIVGLALTALIGAIGGTTYGMHSATKPKVVIQPTQ